MEGENVKRLLSVLTAAVFVLSFASAALADMTADDVIAKHLEKTGGIENYKKMNTLRMTGKAFIGQMTADFSIENQMPNLFHMKFVSEMFTMETASDGKDVWQQMPMVEGFIFADSADLPKQLERMRMNPYLDYKERGVKVKLVGEEPVKGADCYKLEWIAASGDTSYIYFDKENFYEVKKVEAEAEILNAKFKEVDGFTFPHKMTQTMGAQRLMFIINTIETNVELEPSLFVAPPDSLRAPPEVVEQIKKMQEQQGGGE
jgi:hypothetical protein